MIGRTILIKSSKSHHLHLVGSIGGKDKTSVRTAGREVGIAMIDGQASRLTFQTERFLRLAPGKVIDVKAWAEIKNVLWLSR